MSAADDVATIGEHSLSNNGKIANFHISHNIKMVPIEEVDLSFMSNTSDGQCFVDHPCCSAFNAHVDVLPMVTSPVCKEMSNRHWKHVFILSDAGKPIYTRYGDEEGVATHMSVIHALVNFVSSVQGDQLISMEVGLHRFVFSRLPPLILCIIGRLGVTVAQLQIQMRCLYQYIVSVLTASQLRRIFEERKNFDLRRLLTGTNRTLDKLLDSAESDFSLMLGAVPSLKVANSLRDTIVQTVASQCAQAKMVNFAVLLVNDKVLAVSCRKGLSLSWSDLHLLINLVASNPSFKDAELWSPICLPGYDENNFLSAYISHLDDNCPVCLMLLTDDKGAFFQMSAVRSGIVQKLNKSKALSLLKDDIDARSDCPLPDLLISDLVHFVYKNTAKSLYASTSLRSPHDQPAFRTYLFDRYMRAQGYVSRNRLANGRYVFYATGPLDTMLAWVTQSFELYAAFNPLITKTEAIARVEQVMRWIKKEENDLFPGAVVTH